MKALNLEQTKEVRGGGCIAGGIAIAAGVVAGVVAVGVAIVGGLALIGAASGNRCCCKKS